MLNANETKALNKTNDLYNLVESGTYNNGSLNSLHIPMLTKLEKELNTDLDNAEESSDLYNLLEDAIGWIQECIIIANKNQKDAPIFNTYNRH